MFYDNKFLEYLLIKNGIRASIKVNRESFSQ